MFAFGKNKELRKKLDEYLLELNESMSRFNEALEYLLANEIDEHFKTLAKKMHQHESRADDIRREIERYMFHKSLLPETREDLLNIIEMIDKIPNEGQAVLNDFLIQKTELFEPIKKNFLELMKDSIETFNNTLEAFKNCFDKGDMIDRLSQIVDNNESLGDSLEREMIKTIFDSDIDKAEKIIQRDFVIKLGNICDLCESSMDKIVVASIKRFV
jgi:predicted phosphate transport protein (TIGR00153 family)